MLEFYIGLRIQLDMKVCFQCKVFLLWRNMIELSCHRCAVITSIPLTSVDGKMAHSRQYSVMSDSIKYGSYTF
jgi:hypothetical protein